MKYLYKITCLLLILSCIIKLSGCGLPSQPLSKTGFYFNTVITVSLYDSADAALLEGCFSIADTYEKMLSKTVEGSDIWNINHANGHTVTVQEDTVLLLQRAIDYADLTDGKVDPTIGAVNKLWDFSDSNSAAVPDEALILKALSHVNYQLINITGNQVTLTDPDAALDMGFIAKGYIADQMKEYLQSAQVESAIINLGGNVLTIGSKPDGTPFAIGIQKPFAPEGTSLLTLPVSDISVVSSGTYERYFEQDGQLYHHILDTKTGYPVWNSLSEVTILSSSSTDGDALSTACFVLGLEKGTALIESLENTEAIFLTGDGVLHPTSGVLTGNN